MAAGFGAVLLGLSTTLIFAGLLLASESEPGAGVTLIWGFATLPLGFLTVAMLSMPQKLSALMRPTLNALTVDVVASVVLLAILGFVGGGAPAALTAGVGLGGTVVLRQPPEVTRKTRFVAVAAVSVVTFALELVGLAIVALLGPFLVLPVINLVDNRTILKVDTSKG